MRKPDEAGRLLRQPLLDLLDRSHRYALTLLLAPAGAGKSTLLEQWCVRQGRRYVFLSLGSADADPVRFFRRLDRALRSELPDFEGFSYNELSVEAGVPAELVAEALVEGFSGVSEELTVIIDDFQHASHPLIQSVIGTLVYALPEHVHFVLGTRSHPDFSLSRLKLDDQLLVLDGHDLRLDPAELNRFAAHLLGRDLDDEESEHLYRLTEGWAAGVKLALLAGAGKERLPLETFTGSRPELVDYFAYVVLRDLSDQTRQFLLATALLDGVSAPLCDFILDTRESRSILDELVGRGLFIQPLAGRDGWYRYHPLFQEFLRDRLEGSNPETVPVLRRRAAQWFAANAEPHAALSHASQCQDDVFFHELLRECCARWIKSGEFNHVVTWVEPLPEETLLRDWELLVPLTGALIFSRRFHQAGYYLEALKSKRISPAGELGDYSMVPFLEILLQVFQHDSEFQLAADQEVLMRSASHHDIRAFALAMLAYHRLLHGDLEQAFAYGGQAKEVLGQLGYDYLESYADLILILCNRASGRMLEATQYTYEMCRRHTRHEGSQSWINGIIALAVVEYEQNNLDKARREAERLIPLVSSACATEVIANAYLTLSRILNISGQSVRGLRLLDDLERVLRLGGYERFLSQTAFERARHAFASGDTAELDRLVRNSNLDRRWRTDYDRGHTRYSEIWERQGLVVALWLRAHGRLDEAELVLRCLKRVLEDKGINTRAVVMTANIAVLRLEQGDQAEAMALLAEKIRFPGQSCFNRTLFDEAPGAGRWLAMGIREGMLVLPELYFTMFGPLLEASENPVSPAPAVEPLTSREQHILELLREGLSNEQISQSANVALSTTKWHLKNIYAKLGVANRTEAVVRAPRL
ncbi:MAG: LuxR C-terminal-related transcriptional regulator [Alcanivoracaceae bacterium]|nr:LuxR C-terminal-related transcriptional regulator [Alcanivoracaceae bacterium]